MIEQGIHGHRNKIHQHDLRHWTQARHGGCHRRAQKRGLTDGRIAHALTPESHEQPAVQSLHILAQQKDAWVFGHRLPERIIYRFGKSDASHAASLSGRNADVTTFWISLLISDSNPMRRPASFLTRSPLVRTSGSLLLEV